MCGIVGGVVKSNLVPILMDGLKKLEYRGYDSAGLAVIGEQGICCKRMQGKVKNLQDLLDEDPISGCTGIAHTRWATHGKPSSENAHPHICRNKIAVVHNGIIENYRQLQEQQLKNGYVFASETDTEVIVNEIFDALRHTDGLLNAVKRSIPKFEGTYALGIMSNDEPGLLVACRQGSPLVIGVGAGEYFIASDVAALLPVTQRFIFLENGDIAAIRQSGVTVFDRNGRKAVRPVKESLLTADSIEKGEYRHFMLKEIFEQSFAVARTLQGRFVDNRLQESAFGRRAAEIFDAVRAVQIVACGTSYHAGLIARYWLERLARIPCSVEIASEFRYREPILGPDTLAVAISQSGETADTLAALQEAKKRGAKYSLAICNVPESSLVREADAVLMTRAGPEIGVASTKAFTSQLTVSMLLVIALGRRFGLSEALERQITAELFNLPAEIEKVLQLNDEIKNLARQFTEKHHALFLGRGSHYPIALEGALKLKEISYIHAEAYPAGELKHGPLALIDAGMPVVTVAPNDHMLEKLKANMEEVSARDGQLIVFIDERLASAVEAGNFKIIKVPQVENHLSPAVYNIPLQLLSYHVAALKGTDIDQPRNLAKSVTVE
ncbi:MULTISPECIES: glutamine--fructose-6-phosphate transaminase (isomerizing) [Methylomicrobium]|uniref:Glutamine--fructose-6-phosphate aminotransferase [isomerizing] n=1 Tax=Methylomicrobium album BG8 TaxID=686340 RepID=H8GRE4_METAL|nr:MULTISPECIES: glutamine--fructose-6-phosphate transaminase (isomerizing) [Methylomicrobium]EIC31123.1 glucosamine--fructose-6-phosphate aminotransferase, isomerizing [Methylomicrobium album BG8]